uniref:Uncharacterized protein n=1 Tax=viral metagenome TaxID=1070528 RepID=A0A6H2A5I6_9ZZZZ
MNMARYDSLRKLKRNKELCWYRDKHPELSWREIGEHFGISVSRAYRIWDKKRKEENHGKGN